MRKITESTTQVILSEPKRQQAYLELETLFRVITRPSGSDYDGVEVGKKYPAVFKLYNLLRWR